MESGFSRTSLGIVIGGGVLVAIMLALAGVTIAMGWVRNDSAGTLVLGPWIVLEVIGGAFACIIGGVICRRISCNNRGPTILAGLILTIGMLEAGEVVRFVASGRGAAPIWLVLLAPLVGAAGVLIGGWRPAQAVRSKGRMRLCFRSMETGLRYAAPPSVLIAATLLAVFVLPALPQESKPEVFAAALTLDFTVAVPALVYAFFVRTRRAPWLVLVPTVVAGFMLATATLPGEHHFVLNAMRYLAIPAELVIVIYLVRRARQAFAGTAQDEGDFATRFRAAAIGARGNRVVADILTTEVSVLYYAFCRPRRRQTNQSNRYTVYRRVGYSAVMFGLMVVVLAETITVHILLSMWSATAAWILTLLSMYACLWLIGDYRAMVARPMRLTASHLQLRVGLRWEVDVPIERIGSAEPVRSSDGRGEAQLLNAALLQQPNVRIRINAPVEVIGMYGIRRKAREILLTVDEPDQFCRAINSIPG